MSQSEMGRVLNPKGQEESVNVTRIITRSDQSQVLRVRCARLLVVQGEQSGQEITISRHGIVVGADAQCDLTLTDDAVSRRHVEIRPVEKGFRVRDLGSKNGTRIAGLNVKDVVLDDNQDICIGHTTLQLQLLQAHEEHPISSRSEFGQVIGRSLVMRQVFAVLELAAKTDATLLLQGESGTGKDLIAQEVHQHSRRAKAPFVVVDCGSMKASLVESELFGHCKGAFTGADSHRTGAFESARGGTVLLDEIGELPADLQPKLLRVLENRTVKRLGENQDRPIDVRVIAATNRDLTKEVEQGRFRQDLYFRLSVINVRVPPLRERREDVAELAKMLVQRLHKDLDPNAIITSQVISVLCSHEWKGNVRELRNMVERLIIFPNHLKAAATKKVPQTGQVPQELLGLSYNDARDAWLSRFDREYLLAMLDASDGVVARAAERAGMPRQSFHRLMSKRGLLR